jgi:hypothetical protein
VVFDLTLDALRQRRSIQWRFQGAGRAAVVVAGVGRSEATEWSEHSACLHRGGGFGLTLEATVVVFGETGDVRRA